MRLTATTLAICVSLISALDIAKADTYRLQPGDSIEFSVAGMPSLQRRVKIDIDGNVSLPVIGTLNVASLTIEDLQRSISASIPKKPFNFRGSDGSDNLVTIDYNEINVNIAEYRPVYISGDVSKPGEVAYTPNLTIKQAVALSGGYDIVRYRLQDPFIVSADYKAVYEKSWLEVLRRTAQRNRILFELGRAKSIAVDSLGKIPVDALKVKDIVQIEVDKAQERALQFEGDLRLQTKLFEASSARFEHLSDQQKTEQKSADLDAQETTRLSDLQQKGVVPITRLVDQRRLNFLSANGALEVSSRVEQSRADVDRAQRSINLIKENRNRQLLDELQEANKGLDEAREDLKASQSKLYYAGIVRSKLKNGPGGLPKFMITRTEGGKTTNLEGTSDLMLRPGDYIEVDINMGTNEW